MSPWPVLESLRTPAAVSAVWRSRLGEFFDAFTFTFLQRTSVSVSSYPCPRGCGCAHEVIHRTPTEIAAACRCESWCCDDIHLTAGDLSVWQLSWTRLGSSLCAALELHPKLIELNIENTRQVGSWAANAVPVIITVQHTSAQFREVLTALVARLRQPFILLAPTANHLDASVKELLAGVGAGFFSLEAHVRFGKSGVLSATTAPGQLFTTFTADPADTVSEDVARRAFALLQQLDSARIVKPPTLLTVFRLYCIDELSAAAIAHKCRCSKATVIRRLELIHEKTSLDPQSLRQISSHLDKIDTDIVESGAAHIQRRRLIYDADEEDEC